MALFQACMLFVELKYTLATEEAERIGVDHVARYSLSGSTERSSGKRERERENATAFVLGMQ